MRFFGFLLFFISISALATDTTRVRNVKCKGGWVTEGTSKLEVISYCGQPKFSDITSGANMVKNEDLLFVIKRKDYIISFSGGKVTHIGMIK
ncbi:DUF2845 domain-containing protein [Glaciecola sp. XM2]|uniref:DUF2845 domain-containing protein n=2 Tax=Alteromonadaceae TaxID=72275 RepID=UPI001BDF117D|nr:DUF2845 domain-containing protein [Alteromonas stellipolaris]MBT1451921.1 DUF2845 domain-containing protein [Glaciecola sp. XM2]MCQ8849834.1 DUF2845 domain-containing protein [Alteromonas stellipolaris]